MKLLRRLAAVLLCLLLALSCAACTQDPGPQGGGPSGGGTVEGGGDDIGDGNNDDGKDDDNDGKDDGNDDNNDDGKDDGDDKGDGKDDGDDKGDVGGEEHDRAADYAFRPVISEVLPRIDIVTSDGSNSFATVPNRDAKLEGKIEYVNATVSVSDCEEAFELNGLAAKVKARGNYTLDYSKKPIRIKLDKKNNLLGLHEGKKYKNWVLLADWKDLSMSNNTTAFYLGKTILGSDGYYCSDYRNVNVYLNGQDWGVYLLVEQQEAKDGRSSVPEVPELENEAGEEVGYTGTDVGYFMEYDGYYTDEINMPNREGDPTFTVNYNNFSPLTRVDGSRWTPVPSAGVGDGTQIGYTVKSDIYDDGQLTFLKNYVENAYRAVYDAVYRNEYKHFNADYTALVPSAARSAKEVAEEIFDLPSLVDTYILNEIACDPDIGWSSFYLSADFSETGAKKLIFEAPWDFDSAFGIKNGFVNSGVGQYAGFSTNPWLVMLSGQAWFTDMVAAKWAELKQYGVLGTALELVLEQKETYESAYARNYTRWEERLGGGNGELTWEVNSFRTQGEAADYLHRWLENRFAFLDTVWGDGSGVSDVPARPEEGATAYPIEAEDCEFYAPVKRDNWHSEVTSGGYFLGQLSGNTGATVSFDATVTQATEAYLSVTLSKRTYLAFFPQWFSVKLNGTVLDVPLRAVAACSAEEEWYAWTEVFLMPVHLNAGTNRFVFTVLGDATNIDLFTLYAKTEITY